MTTKQLQEILLKHNLCINHIRKTVGMFAQYEIGTGRLIRPLINAMEEIKKLHGDCLVCEVDNPEHEQYQQKYLFIDSFAADPHLDPVAHNRIVHRKAILEDLKGVLAKYKVSHPDFLDCLADFLGGEQWEIDPTVGSKYDIDDAVTCIRRAIGQAGDEEDEEDEEE